VSVHPHIFDETTIFTASAHLALLPICFHIAGTTLYGRLVWTSSTVNSYEESWPRPIGTQLSNRCGITSTDLWCKTVFLPEFIFWNNQIIPPPCCSSSRSRLLSIILALAYGAGATPHMKGCRNRCLGPLFPGSWRL